MAKRTNRVLIGLTCEVCKRQNYVSEKNKVNSPDKVAFTKFCKQCKTKTNHKEKQKLK
ncbi:50S ribosomal protein L33 [candidate division WWE3 bacterium]|nr:50S ribosomal protein L33 [candidate division WWE3 bacterium]MBT7350760.1 50S ribosomal protein L33 [candidate division WWE3 bacterium]